MSATVPLCAERVRHKVRLVYSAPLRDLQVTDLKLQTSMADSVSVQRQTAEAIVDAFNRMDVEAIVSFRAPECLRFILPASLNQPPTNNEQYRASLLRVKEPSEKYVVARGLGWRGRGCQ